MYELGEGLVLYDEGNPDAWIESQFDRSTAPRIGEDDPSGRENDLSSAPYLVQCEECGRWETPYGWGCEQDRCEDCQTENRWKDWSDRGGRR